MRLVEVDHLKTGIIALHEEFKVVEDEGADAANKREKEALHMRCAGEVGEFQDVHLQPQSNEEEEKNRTFEDLLARENIELSEEVQALTREIERVNRERDEQARKYNAAIKSKEDTVAGLQEGNFLLRRDVGEMKAVVRLEQLEVELNQLKASNERDFNQKARI